MGGRLVDASCNDSMQELSVKKEKNESDSDQELSPRGLEKKFLTAMISGQEKTARLLSPVLGEVDDEDAELGGEGETASKVNSIDTIHLIERTDGIPSKAYSRTSSSPPVLTASMMEWT